MKFHYLFFTIAVFSLMNPTLSVAQNIIDDIEISANVGIFNDYSFRGISQSNENVALQGGFDASHKTGLYAGVWGSNVNFSDSDEASVEVDLYAGYAGAFKGFNFDLGAIYYTYPGADSSLDYDFYELAASVGYDFDAVNVSISGNYSPDYFGASGDSLYSTLSIKMPIIESLNLNTHVGHQTIDDNNAFGTPDYTDWSIGLGYNFDNGFTLSAQYVDTDLSEPNECADECSERFILGLSKSF